MLPLLLALVLLAGSAGSLTPTQSGTVELKAFQMGLPDGLFQDRRALLALKAIISPGGFGTSSIQAGWPTSPSAANSDPCRGGSVWPHITCAGNRVTEIKLGGLGISGSGLPVELMYMNRLTSLQLEDNLFSGELPNDWSSYNSFQSLVELRLSNNRLSGTLPAWKERGSFRQLSRLLLNGNLLIGSLPTTWANNNRPLRALVELDLSNNLLGQNPSSPGSYLPLPDGSGDWGSNSQWGCPFPRLKILNLGGNYFTGSLPDWGKQYGYPALEKLYLGNNRLSGALRASYGDRWAFPRLQELQLQGNNLGVEGSPGGLPSAWTAVNLPRPFPSLRKLVLFEGNENICAPDIDNPLQGGAAYDVTDEAGNIYLPGTITWRLC